MDWKHRNLACRENRSDHRVLGGASPAHLGGEEAAVWVHHVALHVVQDVPRDPREERILRRQHLLLRLNTALHRITVAVKPTGVTARLSCLVKARTSIRHEKMQSEGPGSIPNWQAMKDQHHHGMKTCMYYIERCRNENSAAPHGRTHVTTTGHMPDFGSASCAALDSQSCPLTTSTRPGTLSPAECCRTCVNISHSTMLRPLCFDSSTTAYAYVQLDRQLPSTMPQYAQRLRFSTEVRLYKHLVNAC